jgi:hypothetical protein
MAGEFVKAKREANLGLATHDFATIHTTLASVSSEYMIILAP